MYFPRAQSRVCTVCPMKTKVFKLDKYTQTRTHKINQINAIENCIQSAAIRESEKNNELNVWHVHSARTLFRQIVNATQSLLIFFFHFLFVRRLRQCSLVPCAHSPALFYYCLFRSSFVRRCRLFHAHMLHTPLSERNHLLLYGTVRVRVCVSNRVARVTPLNHRTHFDTISHRNMEITQ